MKFVDDDDDDRVVGLVEWTLLTQQWWCYS